MEKLLENLNIWINISKRFRRHTTSNIFFIKAPQFPHLLALNRCHFFLTDNVFCFPTCFLHGGCGQRHKNRMFRGGEKWLRFWGYDQWNYSIPNWVVCWYYVAIDAPVTELLFNATYSYHYFTVTLSSLTSGNSFSWPAGLILRAQNA